MMSDEMAIAVVVAAAELLAVLAVAVAHRCAFGRWDFWRGPR